VKRMQNDANNKSTLTPDECSALYHIGNVTLRRLLDVRSMSHPAAHCRFRASADFR
jgi:hypothetical protein